MMIDMLIAELTLLLTAIQEAGTAVEALRIKGVTTTTKENNSPLTEADLLANVMLKTALLEAFPNDGWLSEETVDDKTRLTHQRVWIVDPIDGTKEFIKNIKEYAVSVALVENGTPILAAVFNPATDELFYAIKSQGAWLNGQPITCKAHTSAELHLLASRTEFAEGRWDNVKRQHHVRITGSIAYKLALVANGTADATFSLTPKSEWDIAAGALLVTEAGGIVTQLNGDAFIFNRQNTRVDGIIATSKETYQPIIDLIESTSCSKDSE